MNSVMASRLGRHSANGCKSCNETGDVLFVSESACVRWLKESVFVCANERDRVDVLFLTANVCWCAGVGVRV